MHSPSFLTTSLTVRPWPDPVIDEVGHRVHSAYVERFWLGLLGPSSTWLLRRLVARLDESPEGYELDLALTATELGLGARSGRHSPFIRSIERCCRFGVAHRVDDATLRVRRKLPPLTRIQVARLPAALQAAHATWTDPSASRLSVDEMRERARGLALSLLLLGEDSESTERQLHAWQVHPAVAHEAVSWAIDHRSSVIPAAPTSDLPPEAA